MASSGHLLVQQSPMVSARIKLLVNNDLKTICRAYGQAVSGTKVNLQARCITILESLVAGGDVTRFNEFSARVNNHGLLPLKTSPAATARPGYNMPAGSPVAPRPGYPSATRLEFKSSPFYERLEVVLRAQDLPEMPQNRHTVKANLILTDEQARRLSADPQQYRLMVYCAQPNLYDSCDIAFPPQIEIKVNDDDVKANFKGLKNKPGSTKPADITRMVRLRAGYPNKLSVCYALTTKRYLYTIWLVRYVAPEALVQKIRANRVFPKHKVIEEIQRLNNDPDISAMSSKMSLKDPISTSRITVPVRSTICSHNQCFDASYFLQLQEQAPTWQCPLCNKTVSFESLSVDKYFDEILQNTPRSTEQVTIEPNGEWRVITDEEKAPGSAAKNAPRASYDDDFDDDDDLVELDGDKQAVKKESTQAALNAFSTPPLSSREPSVAQSHPQAGNKRSAAIIDLTLSDDDDDDEPIRPSKRTRPDDSSRSHPYVHTPTSVLDASSKPTDALHRPPSVNPSGNYTPNMMAPLKSPISLSPFNTTTAPAAAFGAPSDLNTRPSSHMSTSAGGFPNSWSSFRSPSLPFADVRDAARRSSASKSPLMSWQTAPSNASIPDTQQARSHTYRGFSQDQSNLQLPNNFLPNGWGDSASPG
ncbi:hypothetical protein AMS68_003948 [Peltaster fructicola]|uniref:SP-RING-type domain-containing protein n=1 Tax=Peltaster fructicola TaxID=286661 RepID=A0A6H0XUT8_9PEZI|nr:hypothetical protein AMS68_003948 [Peltaster fructicola]